MPPSFLLAFTNSYLLYLSVPSDFNKSTVRVEGSCPTGIDMCPIVVVEDPDKIGTLQLGQVGSEKEQG